MKPFNPSNVLSRMKLKQGGCALALGLGFAVLCSLSAQAQYYGHGRGPYGPDDFDGPYTPYGGPYGPYGNPPSYDPYNAGPGGPPGPIPAYRGPRSPDEYDLPPGQGPRPPSYSGPSGPPPSAPRGERGPVSATTIESRIHAAGYRLIAPPRQKGKIYLAEVEDSKSVRHRLIYDANDGHLIENTPLGPVKKPSTVPPEESKAPMDREPDVAKAVPPPPTEVYREPGPPVSHMDEPAPPAPYSTDGK